MKDLGLSRHSNMQESSERMLDDNDTLGECVVAYESLSTRIYRLSDPTNSLGGRTGVVAIKVLVDERPDRIVGLYDEYILSGGHLLSRCGATRAAIKHSRYNGMPAIYLEWAEGVTLGEWVRSIHRNLAGLSVACVEEAQHLLYRIVNAAWIISGALSEVHEAGVIHNNISVDNVIVDDVGIGNDECQGEGCHEHTEGRGDFSVKIIDFGSASLLNKNSDIDSDREKRKDLFSLGVTLFELFSGQQLPKHNDHEQSGDNGHPDADTQTPASPSLDMTDTLPRTMRRFVSTVIAKLMRKWNEAEEHAYTSAREVQRDMCQLLDYPERFLRSFDGPNDNPQRLDFPPKRLYGRRQETSILLDSFFRVTALNNQRPEMILVSGVSGSGKTSFVEQAQEPTTKRGGYFISGKFSSHQPVEPLSALIAAFTDYCDQVLANDQGTLDRTRADILEQVGSDSTSLLVGLIPSLQQVLRSEPALAPVKIGSLEAQNRFRHTFLAFVRAIASPAHPIVLFLDDLQWADAASLELIERLVTDTESRSILVIGCCRDNEITSCHRMSHLVQEIRKQGVTLTHIELDNISRDVMNHLISDTLFTPRSLTKDLTDIVYSRTDGNAFFAVEFLKSLFDAGVLYFSQSSGSWHWNTIDMQVTNISDSAVELIMSNLRKLPTTVVDILEIAACLGCQFEEATLRIVLVGELLDADATNNAISSDGDYLAEVLGLAVCHGLIERAGSAYKFSHDQIQHAAYSLIPENERCELHLRIGKRLWKKCPQAKFEEMIFQTVNQLHLGSALVHQKEKVDLSKLYLRAGRKAMSSSLFTGAAFYLKEGIGLLDPGHWEDEYKLCLDLYSSCAECEYCNGNLDEMKQALNEVFTHARCFDEKLSGYDTLVKALGGINELQEAAEIGFQTLENLGIHFPDAEDAGSHLLRELGETRQMLDGYTDETLITLKLMTDERKIAAMDFLKWVSTYTHMVKQEYLPLAVCRMVKLSLTHGVCHESAAAFAAYGIILIRNFGYYKRGYQFGQIALQLMKRFESKEPLARVHVVVYGFINNWNEHIELSLEPLLYGYQTGLVFGDFQYAVSNAYRYCLCSFLCGKQIASLEKELGVFCDQMEKNNQKWRLTLALLTRQLLQNLMGRSKDPLQLSGDAMDQDTMLRTALAEKNSYHVCYIYVHRMWLAYLFGDYMLAAEMADKSRNVDKIDGTVFAITNHAFIDGLASLALARSTKEGKWKVLADGAMENMKTWALQAPCNFQHKVALLEAEFAFLGEHHADAQKCYESSIAIADSNGFLHEKAIACERYAIYCSEIGDKSKASNYFEEAYNLYLDWGARSKADHVRSRLLSFLMAEDT